MSETFLAHSGGIQEGGGWGWNRDSVSGAHMGEATAERGALDDSLLPTLLLGPSSSPSPAPHGEWQGLSTHPVPGKSGSPARLGEGRCEAAARLHSVLLTGRGSGPRTLLEELLGSKKPCLFTPLLRGGGGRGMKSVRAKVRWRGGLRGAHGFCQHVSQAQGHSHFMDRETEAQSRTCPKSHTQ